MIDLFLRFLFLFLADLLRHQGGMITVHITIVKNTPIGIVHVLQVRERRVVEIHTKHAPILLVGVFNPLGGCRRQVGVIIACHTDDHMLHAALVADAFAQAARALVCVEVPPQRNVDIGVQQQIFQVILQLRRHLLIFREITVYIHWTVSSKNQPRCYAAVDTVAERVLDPVELRGTFREVVFGRHDYEVDVRVHEIIPRLAVRERCRRVLGREGEEGVIRHATFAPAIQPGIK